MSGIDIFANVATQLHHLTNPSVEGSSRAATLLAWLKGGGWDHLKTELIGFLDETYLLRVALKQNIIYVKLEQSATVDDLKDQLSNITQVDKDQIQLYMANADLDDSTMILYDLWLTLERPTIIMTIKKLRRM